MHRKAFSSSLQLRAVVCGTLIIAWSAPASGQMLQAPLPGVTDPEIKSPIKSNRPQVQDRQHFLTPIMSPIPEKASAQDTALTSFALPSSITGGDVKRVNCTIDRQRDLDTELKDRLDNLLMAAAVKAKTPAYGDAVHKYNSAAQRGVSTAADMLRNNFGFPRGMDTSIEGSQAVLDEDITIKDLSAAQYKQQKELDELHTAIVAKFLQLAEALGENTAADAANTSASVDRASDAMKSIVGNDETERTVDMLASWKASADISKPYFKQQSWQVDVYREKLRKCTELALKWDPIVVKIDAQLRAWMNHSKGERYLAKTVEGGVSLLTMLGPGIGVPIAAQVFGAAYARVNGGSEESKLIREIYLAKRLESRRLSVNEESQLALMEYQRSVDKENPLLMIASETVLSQLVGAVGIPQVLDAWSVGHTAIGSETVRTLQTMTTPASVSPGNKL